MQYFWSFVIVLASVRGFFVLHFDLPATLIYITSSALLISIGLLSIGTLVTKNGYKSFVLLKNAIKLNMIFISFYMIVTVFIFGMNSYDFLYFFCIFPVIFNLIKFEEKFLTGIVVFIILTTVLGVFYIYIIGVTGGFDVFSAVKLKLRPGELSYSRIDENLLSFGYQGSHHDAANILVMCGIFLLSKVLSSHGFYSRYSSLVGYFLATASILVTGSASNSVIFFSMSIITCWMQGIKKSYVMILTGFFFVLSFGPDISEYFFFIQKITSHHELVDGGMLKALDLDSILRSIHSIVFGFGYVLNVPLIVSEVAFVKMLINFGVVPFCILVFISLSPIYYNYKIFNNIQSRMQLFRNNRLFFRYKNLVKVNLEHRRQLSCAVMPVIAGALTLLHYGSLFRVTSIGLFCVFLAIYFKKYLFLRDKLNEV